MSQLRNIVEGYTNWIFPDQETEEMSANRLKICQKCPERSDSTNKKVTMTSYCKLCGCILQSKSRAPHAQCPELKWPEDAD